MYADVTPQRKSRVFSDYRGLILRLKQARTSEYTQELVNDDNI